MTTIKAAEGVDNSKNEKLVQDDDPLFNSHFDTKDLSVLIEQYKIYIESANLTSSLRSQANTFFLTINTALIGFVSGISGIIDRPFTPLWIITVSIAGILLCISWLYSIRSFRALNSGRFAVIHEIEKRLPARIYAREWELVSKRQPSRKRYIRQTQIEQFIPVAFGLLYVGLALMLFLF